MRLSRDQLRRLSEARERLREVTEPALTIEDVARSAGVSPFHFSRQFEAVFGATPHQFRIGARLERARHLLALGDLSVTEVCLEVGWSSLGSFSDLFRRRVGVSPAAYRREVRAAGQVPEALTRALMPGCLGLMGMLPPGTFRSFREAPPGVPGADSPPSRGAP